VKASRSAVRRLIFSPDSKLVAATPELNGPLRIWDAATGQVVHQLEPPRAERHHFGTGVVFAPDGKTLAATGSRNDSEGVVHLWDMPSGKYHGELSGLGGELAISPDSKLIAVAGASDVRVWDLATNKELAADDKCHRKAIGCIRMSSDGVVVTASEDHTVRTWEVKTGRQTFKLAHNGWVPAIAVSPDGTKLASSSLDNTVRLWELKTGREIYKLPGHGRLGGYRALGFTTDSKRFVSWGDDWYLRGWEVATGKAFLDERLTPIGSIASTDGENSRDAADLGVTSCAFAPDAKTLVLRIGSKLHLFDATMGRPLRFFDAEYEYGEHVVVSPDGKLVWVASWGKATEMPLPGGRVRTIEAKEHPVGLWDLAEGKLVREMSLPGRWGVPVAFSADGKTCAAASDEPERMIRLWDTASGEELRTITGFRSRVTALAFAPDGRHLIAGLDDTTALVWKVSADRK
jgi:WD40 repeat protein